MIDIKLLILLFVGLSLRLFGLNWDQGFHLHPDERMLIMVADRIRFFTQMNPDFFNYGSLPIYLLKGTAQLSDLIFSSHFANYDGMLYLGRFISVIADLLVIILVYKLTNFLFKKEKIALVSAFFYTVAFFPIQNSHFFVSDVFLTLLSTLLIYLILKYFDYNFDHDRIKSGISFVTMIGVVFAAMMATKFTAIIFLPLIVFLILIKTFKQSSNLISNFINFCVLCFVFSVLCLVFSFIFMPYAFIEHKRFLSDIFAQIKMNSDPYIFPYTLQYVPTLPYLYYLKNIFLWGLGPLISILSLFGFLTLGKDLLDRHSSAKKHGTMNMKQYLLIMLYVLCYMFYFVVIGRSAVKFMRYMLPIYPFLTILAGLGLYKIYKRYKHYGICGLLILQTLWSLSFINIYSQKHTRIAATEWINKNIPAGSTLAIEHWDDRIPLTDNGKYKYAELPLYELPDDNHKWDALVNPQLEKADYIIIASNRLYVPLQKLSDCGKYKKCYPKTAEYYRRLFNEQTVILGSEAASNEASATLESDSGQARITSRLIHFTKIAEFAVYPKLEIGNWKLEIRDGVADESFTVYDHPKVIIFKKT